MINSITIKDVASYCAQGVTIENLGMINFIYGANGCGKTTISNYFLDSSSNKYSNCSHSWKQNSETEVLVYNKEFRDRNFGEGNVRGIFTLGEATKDEIEFIEKKTIELKEQKITLRQRQDNFESKHEEKKILEENFKEQAWNKVFKRYEAYFKAAFSGVMGKKESFKVKLLEQYKSNDCELILKDILIEKASTVFGSILYEQSIIKELDTTRLLDIETDPIWQKVIVGTADVDIAKFINRLNISDWVNEGRKFVENDTCPFCQHDTIDQVLRNQFDSFFDEEYLLNIEQMKRLSDEYLTLTDTLLNYLDSIETNIKTDISPNIDLDLFSSNIKTFVTIRRSNLDLLLGKIKEPSRLISLTQSSGSLNDINIILKNSNEKRGKHNSLVRNIRVEKDLLIGQIWRFVCEDYKDEIQTYISSLNSIDKALAGLGMQIDKQKEKVLTINNLIQEMSANVTSIEPTVNSINRLLRSYGFNNFKIVPYVENGYYQIERDNGDKVENTLSEGEVTFLTFLYFLQRSKGGDSIENVNSERILIVDDPISSLDSNVLFVVSTLLKELIKDIKKNKGNITQLIVLTHNVYFHKETSFEGLNRTVKEKSNFWILRKNNGVSVIQPYGNRNPIQSSYELLWQDLRDWQNNSAITIQNTMRRVLENFFSILGSRRDEYLIGKFETPEEKEICRSLISWINEGSHTLPDDFFIEYPHMTVENYLKVFKDIFIHTDNSGHYNLMMRIEETNEEEISA
ncbi:AAA family ATPase [Sphingobacterium corticibacterium]|uniref:Protein CR006 P-loop domain-containing protein n=1 Tax=Sphingobacterium corticibacterium TaxID=2484746 RepID=A0A4Q6XRH4_9SPHI|nr:AAA family ATPase [Sphingobacterium corticibacterium]RZF62541.1 hypothetical protein EWE74_07005 [Sphingobacterium corticibacterium]